MTNSVEDLLTASFDGYVAELKEFCRIPSVSTDPAYADGMRRHRRMGGATIVGRWHEQRRDRPDRRPSGGPRRMAGRSGRRADGPGLRPLRRATARPGGAMDHPAVRAHGPRRPALCARRCRRQGAGPRADPRRGGIPAGNGPAAGQSEVPDRRRGGGRQRAPGIVPGGECRPPRGRHDRLGRRGHVARRPADRDRRQPGNLRARVHPPRRRQGSALRQAWRQRPEPAPCRRGPGREPARCRRPRSRRGLSRRYSAAGPGLARGDPHRRHGCRRLLRLDRCATAGLGHRRGSAARTPVARADAGAERAMGRLSSARARKP